MFLTCVQTASSSLEGNHLSLMTSPMIRFCLGWVHLLCCWRLKRNSFLYQHQNSLARWWSLLHRFGVYRSGVWNTLGGERMTFVFIVRRCLRKRGSKESGSLKLLIVSGWLLMMASHSQRLCQQFSLVLLLIHYEQCECGAPNFLPYDLGLVCSCLR